MHLLLFCGILTAILPSKNILFPNVFRSLSDWFIIDSLTVQPGDPFPTDLSELSMITSEDLIDTNEIIDPNDDISLNSLTDSNNDSDEEDSINLIISTSTISTTSTTSTLATKFYRKNMARINNIFSAKLSSSSSTKPTPTPEFHGDDEDGDIFHENPLSSSSGAPSVSSPVSRKK